MTMRSGGQFWQEVRARRNLFVYSIVCWPIMGAAFMKLGKTYAPFINVKISDEASGSGPEDLVTIEKDQASIDAVWTSLLAAVAADDEKSAIAHFTPDARKTFSQMFDVVGMRFLKALPELKDMTPISVGDEVAIYTFARDEPAGNRGYSVTFVRDRDLGWLVQQL